MPDLQCFFDIAAQLEHSYQLCYTELPGYSDYPHNQDGFHQRTTPDLQCFLI